MSRMSVYMEVVGDLQKAYIIGDDACLVRYDFRNGNYQVFLTVEYMDQVEFYNKNPDTVRVQIIKATSILAKRNYIDIELMFPGGQDSVMVEN